MQGLNETWEQKMQRTQEIQQEREKALEELGITVEKNNVGVHTPKRMPHLVNLVRFGFTVCGDVFDTDLDFRTKVRC